MSYEYWEGRLIDEKSKEDEKGVNTMGIFVPSEITVSLNSLDRALLTQVVTLLGTLVAGKELVVRVGFENKVPTIKDDIIKFHSPRDLTK